MLRALILLAITTTACAQWSDPAVHYLRLGEKREWQDFPEAAKAQLRVAFDAKPSDAGHTMRITHRDTRHVWKAVLNGKEIAKFTQDDAAIIAAIDVPAGLIRDGENVLEILPHTKATPALAADDIAVGPIELIARPLREMSGEAELKLEVSDAASGDRVPARFTITDERGALVPHVIAADRMIAARPGVIYTATGAASGKLPAGKYRVWASRGFEWSADRKEVELAAGDTKTLKLAIRREVDTGDWVACDPHVHTFEFSRHGDATLAERLVTLAGEGIELAVATDHNLQIDYAKAMAGFEKQFTAVIGNEVTTPKLGHFNVFPIAKEARLIDFRAATWEKLFADIDAVAPGAVVILNHARDLHGGFRPFDPMRHVGLTGENLEGQTLRANAMEVINSGATLNDPLVLFRDWMGCVNRGMKLAPIGASDSHDVSRFIVGQGRTYVRCDDTEPGKIDMNAAREAFRRGEVLVSYGLLVEMKVNGVEAEITVKGPSWTRVERLELYANGVKIRETAIDPDSAKRGGVKYSVKWALPRFSHDVFLTALAVGPSLTEPFWPGARPYQSTGEHWAPCFIACTGAVYVDADQSGSWESAYEYAQRVVTGAKDLGGVVDALNKYDFAVAAQTASILRARKLVASPTDLERLADKVTADVGAGVRAYAQEWRNATTAQPKQN